MGEQAREPLWKASQRANRARYGTLHAEAVRRFAAGESVPSIASELGVSRTTVRRAVKRAQVEQRRSDPP